MNLEFELRWIFTRDGESEALEALVFDLLSAVRDGGNLNYAAKSTGVSYRHAWGLIRAWETRLGQPLLSSRQGRGARLTKFAESLLAIAADTRAALDPTLATAALEAVSRASAKPVISATRR